eukprot:3219589-Pleurochrysis_carterae.AAC.10
MMPNTQIYYVTSERLPKFIVALRFVAHLWLERLRRQHEGRHVADPVGAVEQRVEAELRGAAALRLERRPHAREHKRHERVEHEAERLRENRSETR